MQLPINNRLRAQYQMSQYIGSNIEDGLVEYMNRQLAVKLANDILKEKPKIFEYEEDPNYLTVRSEVYVFTKDELIELIRKVQMDTSTQIREQMTIVDNFKNK